MATQMRWCPVPQVPARFLGGNLGTAGVSLNQWVAVAVPEKVGAAGESGTDGTFPLETIPPISGPPSPMSQRKDHDPRSQLLIHKAEGKLPESIFSEIHEVDRPALRNFSDFFYCLTKGAFKIDGRNWTALAIPITYDDNAVRYSCSA
jgi:hypothetical protein